MKDLEKRRRVITNLYKLSQMTDEDEFKMKMHEFLSDPDPDLKKFIKYFNRNYACKPRYWA